MSEDMDFQRRLFNILSTLMDGMKSLNTTVASNIEAMGRYDAEFIKISRYHHQLTNDMIDLKSEAGQSRLELTQLRSVIDQRFSEINQRFSEANQRLLELNQRLNAIFHRLDDIENTVDGNSSQIKELQIEARSQYNDILTAIQDSSNNTISLRSLSERLDNLERRLGL